MVMRDSVTAGFQRWPTSIPSPPARTCHFSFLSARGGTYVSSPGLRAEPVTPLTNQNVDEVAFWNVQAEALKRPGSFHFFPFEP